MLKKLLAITLLVPALVVVGFVFHQTRNSRPKKIKSDVVKYKNLSKNTEARQLFPHTKRRKLGKIVADQATLEQKVGYKVLVPKITGLKPTFRVNGYGAVITFSNGVTISQIPRNLRPLVHTSTNTVTAVDTETIAAAYYRGQVESSKQWSKDAYARPSNINELRYIKGYPALVMEKGFQLYGKDKTPIGPSIQFWRKNGIEVIIKGSSKMNLAQLIKIAESAI